tara:strand:+ start:600 stop:776 length:177 start_codon:yes stop_codon:yes gene_type:complete
VKTYRKAARKILQDPMFQKDLKENFGGYPQYIGEEIPQAFNVSPEPMRWLKKWLKERF